MKKIHSKESKIEVFRCGWEYIRVNKFNTCKTIQFKVKSIETKANSKPIETFYAWCSKARCRLNFNLMLLLLLLLFCISHKIHTHMTGSIIQYTQLNSYIWKCCQCTSTYNVSTSDIIYRYTHREWSGLAPVWFCVYFSIPLSTANGMESERENELNS